MNLETLRHTAGWSREFVARQLGVSQMTVINWEKGNTEPSISMAIRIARLFGVSLDKLMEAKKE